MTFSHDVPFRRAFADWADFALKYYTDGARTPGRLRPDALILCPEFESLVKMYTFDERLRSVLEAALANPYFPIGAVLRTHFRKERTELRKDPQRWERVLKKRLELLCSVFLRIWDDLPLLGRDRVTSIPLDGNPEVELPDAQWCRLCGNCCQLSGTTPDPPESIRYPGYWYSYIAGDSPVVQEFCPFLFQFFGRDLFFCAIHNVKPLTCLKFGEADCSERRKKTSSV